MKKPKSKSEPETAKVQPQHYEMNFTGVQVDENWEAPRIFVDGMQGFTMNNVGIVSINLVEDLQITPKIGDTHMNNLPHRRVSARLLMSVQQFMSTRDWINQIADSINSQQIIAHVEASDASAKPKK
jgi:hypothetical protein